MSYGHKPVLLNEVIEALNIHAQGCYIDATFGRGGHSREILKRLGPEGRLLAFDKDPDAISAANDLAEDLRFSIVQGSFTMLMQEVQQRQLASHINGILFDFGVSSPQLEDADRGFSFRNDGPLDMRMDPTIGQSVADWLAQAKQDEIANVIYTYGEERASRRIAKAIVNEREQLPITTTKQLAEIISTTIPSHNTDIHPATKTFQALRIFINRELEDITEVLPQAVEVLSAGGRLAAISFHSLEDRIVKRFMRNASTPEQLPPEIPIMPESGKVSLKVVNKKIRASKEEVKTNPRARSATLRVAEKLA